MPEQEPLPSPLDQIKSVLSHPVAGPITKGAITVAATAPVISPLNYASLWAATHGTNSIAAPLRHVASNPFLGIGSHMAKDFLRMPLKLGCTTNLRPEINRRLPNNPFLASALFGLATSVATEVPVNPLEVIKVQLQNGQPIQGLMRGTGVSVARQTPIWSIFGYTYGKSNEHLENNGHNPYDLKWTLPKAAVSATCFLPLAYLMFGRARYELQTRTCASQIPESLGMTASEVENVRSLPIKTAFSAIYKTQGLRGFTAGMALKWASDVLLTAGTIAATEFGKGGEGTTSFVERYTESAKDATTKMRRK